MHMPAKKQKVSEVPSTDAFILGGSPELDEITLQLNEGESISAVGEGVLVVEQGFVLIQGFLFPNQRQGGHRLRLTCDDSSPTCITSCGSALSGASNMKVPYVAAGYARVRLESMGDPSTTLRILKIPIGQSKTFYPQEWSDVSQDIATNVKESQPGTKNIICVCGSKNTGKSSFARYLVNSLLNDTQTVHYLDIDCGQPEFTPPGMVSLVEVSEPILEPPHLQQSTHPTTSYFVGDTSPASDIAAYVKYVRSLYDHARRKNHVIVVNTHGWIQGLGCDVLRQCLASMHITHVVRMHSDQSRQNVISSMILGDESKQSARDYVLPAISSSAPSCIAAREMRQSLIPDHPARPMHAVEKRNLQWYRFCLQCCDEVIKSNMFLDDKVALLLASFKPFSICIKNITISCSFARCWQSQAARVLNGSIVGLCSMNQKGQDTSVGMGGELPGRCYGIGIVRSVIPETDTLFLLTPVTEKDLAFVDCLVIGKLDLPPSLLQTNVLKSPYLAIHGLTADGTAAGQGKSRNNLLRQRALPG